MTPEQQRQLEEILASAGAYEVLHEVALWMRDKLAPHLDSNGGKDYAARARMKAAELSRLAHSILV